MTPAIYIRLADMPTTIAAYTVMGKDEEYTVILNSRLSRERLIQAYEHELRHIANNDFEKDDMELVEIANHGKKA